MEFTYKPMKKLIYNGNIQVNNEFQLNNELEFISFMNSIVTDNSILENVKIILQQCDLELFVKFINYLDPKIIEKYFLQIYDQIVDESKISTSERFKYTKITLEKLTSISTKLIEEIINKLIINEDTIALNQINQNNTLDFLLPLIELKNIQDLQYSCYKQNQPKCCSIILKRHLNQLTNNNIYPSFIEPKQVKILIFISIFSFTDENPDEIINFIQYLNSIQSQLPSLAKDDLKVYGLTTIIHILTKIQDKTAIESLFKFIFRNNVSNNILTNSSKRIVDSSKEESNVTKRDETLISCLNQTLYQEDEFNLCPIHQAILNNNTSFFGQLNSNQYYLNMKLIDQQGFTYEDWFKRHQITHQSKDIDNNDNVSQSFIYLEIKLNQNDQKNIETLRQIFQRLSNENINYRLIINQGELILEIDIKQILIQTEFNQLNHIYPIPRQILREQFLGKVKYLMNLDQLFYEKIINDKIIIQDGEVQSKINFKGDSVQNHFKYSKFSQYKILVVSIILVTFWVQYLTLNKIYDKSFQNNQFESLIIVISIILVSNLDSESFVELMITYHIRNIVFISFNVILAIFFQFFKLDIDNLINKYLSQDISIEEINLPLVIQFIAIQLINHLIQQLSQLKRIFIILYQEIFVQTYSLMQQYNNFNHKHQNFIISSNIIIFILQLLIDIISTLQYFIKQYQTQSQSTDKAIETQIKEYNDQNSNNKQILGQRALINKNDDKFKDQQYKQYFIKLFSYHDKEQQMESILIQSIMQLNIAPQFPLYSFTIIYIIQYWLQYKQICLNSILSIKQNISYIQYAQTIFLLLQIAVNQIFLYQYLIDKLPYKSQLKNLVQFDFNTIQYQQLYQMLLILISIVAIVLNIISYKQKFNFLQFNLNTKIYQPNLSKNKEIESIDLFTKLEHNVSFNKNKKISDEKKMSDKSISCDIHDQNHNKQTIPKLKIIDNFTKSKNSNIIEKISENFEDSLNSHKIEELTQRQEIFQNQDYFVEVNQKPKEIPMQPSVNNKSHPNPLLETVKDLETKLEGVESSLEAYKRKCSNQEGKLKVLENQIGYKDNYIGVLNNKLELELNNYKILLEEQNKLQDQKEKYQTKLHINNKSWETQRMLTQLCYNNRITILNYNYQTICSQCETQAELLCKVCHLQGFCINCFKFSHSQGKKISHTVIRLNEHLNYESLDSQKINFSVPILTKYKVQDFNSIKNDSALSNFKKEYEILDNIFSTSDKGKNVIVEVENWLRADSESFNEEEKLWLLRVFALLRLKEDFTADFNSFKELIKILQFAKFTNKKDLLQVLIKLDSLDTYSFETFREYTSFAIIKDLSGKVVVYKELESFKEYLKLNQGQYIQFKKEFLENQLSMDIGGNLLLILRCLLQDL